MDLGNDEKKTEPIFLSVVSVSWHLLYVIRLFALFLILPFISLLYF